MIVVAGEALVDLVPRDTGELADLSPRLGGGPYNVAVAAGRLGTPVTFLSRISTDPYGDALLHRLHTAGVRTDHVQRGPEPTTLAVVGLEPDGSARYSFYVEGTADRGFTDPGPLPADVTAISVGTLSLVLEPGATAYETVLHREAARGVPVALDPNVRPALITDPDRYRARFARWLPSVALLKVSLDDARWLAGLPDTAPEDDVLRAARDWQQAGPDVVVLTRGGAGLLALTPRGPVTAAPVPVSVVDTIGAGDTVQGALLAWLHDHDALTRTALRALPDDDWRDALGFAARAAAVTCSRAGAEPPHRDELAALDLA